MSYDPKKIHEFNNVDFFVTDEVDFSMRKWGILVSGRNLEEAIAESFDRICILRNGKLERALYYKQMTQIQDERKQVLREIPHAVIKLALIRMAALAAGKSQERPKHSVLNQGMEE